MFTLNTETTVHLRKFSKREEVHGKELVPAVDLAIEQSGSLELLRMFSKELPPMLFCNRAGDQRAGELDLPVDDELPNIRSTLLEMPLALSYEQTGMALRVHYGANEKSHVVLGFVKMHKVRIVRLIEGGSLSLHYSLSCSNEISEKVIGRLGILGGHDISITLEAPEIEQPKPTPDSIDGQGWPFPNKEEPAPQTTPEQALIDTAEQP